MRVATAILALLAALVACTNVGNGVSSGQGSSESTDFLGAGKATPAEDVDKLALDLAQAVYELFTPQKCKQLSAASVHDLLRGAGPFGRLPGDMKVLDRKIALLSAVGCLSHIVNWQEAPIEVVPILSKYLDLSKVAAWYNFPPAVLEALLDANCFVIDLPLPPRMVPGDDRSSAIYNRLEALLADPTFMDVSGIGWMHIDGPIMRALISAGLALPLGGALKRVRSTIPSDLAIVAEIRCAAFEYLIRAELALDHIHKEDYEELVGDLADGWVVSLEDDDNGKALMTCSPLDERDKVRFMTEWKVILASFTKDFLSIAPAKELEIFVTRELSAFFNYSGRSDAEDLTFEIVSHTAFRILSEVYYERGHYGEFHKLAFEVYTGAEMHLAETQGLEAFLKALARHAWGIPILITLSRCPEEYALWKEMGRRPMMRLMQRHLVMLSHQLKGTSSDVSVLSDCPTLDESRLGNSALAHILPRMSGVMPSLALDARCEALYMAGWLFTVGELPIFNEVMEAISKVMTDSRDRHFLIQSLAMMFRVAMENDRIPVAIQYVAIVRMLVKNRHGIAAFACPNFASSVSFFDAQPVQKEAVTAGEAGPFIAFLEGSGYPPSNDIFYSEVDWSWAFAECSGDLEDIRLLYKVLPPSLSTETSSGKGEWETASGEFEESKSGQVDEEEEILIGKASEADVASEADKANGADKASEAEKVSEADEEGFYRGQISLQRWFFIVKSILLDAENGFMVRMNETASEQPGSKRSFYTFSGEAPVRAAFIGGLVWGKAMELRLSMPFNLDPEFMGQVMEAATEESLGKVQEEGECISEDCKGSPNGEAGRANPSMAHALAFVRGAQYFFDFSMVRSLISIGGAADRESIIRSISNLA